MLIAFPRRWSKLTWIINLLRENAWCFIHAQLLAYFYVCERRIYLNNNNNNTPAPSTRISCLYFHWPFPFVSAAATSWLMETKTTIKKPVLILNFTRCASVYVRRDGETCEYTTDEHARVRALRVSCVCLDTKTTRYTPAGVTTEMFLAFSYSNDL